MKKRFLTAAAYLAVGLIVFVVFSHMRPLLPDPYDLAGRILLAGILLVTALLFRKSVNFQDHWRPVYAFFVAVVAMAIDLYVPSREWLLTLFHLENRSLAGIALDKLESSIVLISVILILMRVAGCPPGTLFLRKGRLKKSLTIGLIAFVVAAVGSYFMAQLFGAVNLTVGRILPWIPWILLFILGNSLNEELLFRGLFLDGMAKTLGPLGANLVLILPFVLHHTGVEYTNDALMFLVYLIPLAFFWARITQKTDTLWGSVLFHAGTDISVILVIFSQL
jgi:membrane protease YdiL (CAAX protease family)